MPPWFGVFPFPMPFRLRPHWWFNAFRTTQSDPDGLHVTPRHYKVPQTTKMTHVRRCALSLRCSLLSVSLRYLRKLSRMCWGGDKVASSPRDHVTTPTSATNTLSGANTCHVTVSLVGGSQGRFRGGRTSLKSRLWRHQDAGRTYSGDVMNLTSKWFSVGSFIAVDLLFIFF